MSNDDVFNTNNGWTQSSTGWTQVSGSAPTAWGAINRGNQVVIDGGSTDTVVVDGAFIQAGTVTNGGNTYRVLQSTLAQAQILVDSDVRVKLKPTIFSGLGELAVAAAWSLVVIGADAVQRGTVFIVPVLTSLSYGLLIANILLINGVPDARADASVGKATLAVRAGPRGAALLYAGFALLAHGWLAWGVWHFLPPERAIWGLLSAPFSGAAAVLLWQRSATPDRLRPAIVLTIVAACVHGLAIAAGLLSMRWW